MSPRDWAVLLGCVFLTCVAVFNFADNIREREWLVAGFNGFAACVLGLTVEGYWQAAV